MMESMHDFVNNMWHLLDVLRNDLLMFVVAIAVHALVFKYRRFGGKKVEPKIQPESNKVPRAVRPTAKAPALNERRSIARSTSPSSTSSTEAQMETSAHARTVPPNQYEEVSDHLIDSLRWLQKGAPVPEVDRVLRQAVERDDVGESLVASFVEACIRVNRTDLLESWLRKHRSSFTRFRRAHTFSSVIRAYGAVHDLEGVWRTWQEMHRSHILPSCVTVGCMVEALVANGDADAGYELIHEIQGEEKEVRINAVIYGTVLKGFAHQKKFSRVWAVYQEMLALETDFTVVTFNTIIDACSRCEELHRIPTLLKDMERLSIEPNIITYGAILKGYCQEGSLDKSYELLRTMRENTDFKPDEIMFNSLLDGCARQGRWDRANQILGEMEEAGIKPSNYTLSVLVKVGRRSKVHHEVVFTVCHDLAQKHGVRFNVHVYTNLVHICVDRKDWPRAFAVFAEMFENRIRPETRTYALFLKGMVSAGEIQLANGVLRAALCLPNANPEFAKIGGGTRMSLPKALVSEIVDAILTTCGKHEQELGAQLLQDVKSLGLAIDPKVKLRFAARVAKP